MVEQVQSNYDPLADVLYVSVGEPDRRARSSEDESGLIWRYSSEGECRGVTVRDFKFYWAERLTELSQILSSKLPIAKTKAKSEIREYA